MRLVAAMILIGCQPADAVDKPAVVQPADELAVRFHMYRSFDLGRAIERLLVRGDLDSARALATSIAVSPEPGALEPWGRQISEVRRRAAELVASPGLDEACRSAARLAAACAGCHVETRAAPVFEKPPAVPPDQDTVEAHMARHRWAADRIWEGMIGNADGPWRDGIDVLAQTPLHFPAVAGDRAALATRLQHLVDQARQPQLTDTPAERAQIYGELLVTCAACHTAGAK
jgi:hypothetical protein